MGHVRRLIVFDLDGTLVDSRRDLADSANALIAERGGAPLAEEVVGRMVGDGAAVLVRRALAAAGLAADEASLPRFLALYGDRLLRTTVPYAGALEVVETLAARGPIAVLTNKPLAPAAAILDGLGFSPFIATTIGGDGAFPRKPDPASLRHLMTRHQVSPAETVLVGDSRVDFEAALAAGTRICLARWGFGHETFPVDRLLGDEALLDRPAQIPAAIDLLLS